MLHLGSIYLQQIKGQYLEPLFSWHFCQKLHLNLAMTGHTNGEMQGDNLVSHLDSTRKGDSAL